MRWRVMGLLVLSLGCGGLGCGGEETGGVALPEAAAFSLKITRPNDGEYLGGAVVLVSGELLGAVSTTVRIGDQIVPAEGGRFSQWVSVQHGHNTVVVTHEPSGATDSVSFEVDGHPPALAISGPARATVVTGGSAVLLSFSASDEAGLARVTAAGVDQDLEAGPEWTSQVPLHDGLNLLLVEAEDAFGNVSSESVTVLSGVFGSADDTIGDAVIVHLGQEAIRSFNAVAGEVIDNLDFTAVAQQQNPLLDSALGKVDVVSASIEPGTKLGFSPGDGVISVFAQVSGVVIDTKLILPATQKSWDLTLTVAKVTIAVPLGISMVDGEFSATLLQPTFDFESPEISISAPDGDSPDAAGLEGPVLGSLEKLLTQTALSQGAAVIDLALKRLTSPFVYTLAGYEVSVQLTAVATEATKQGLELRLSGRLSVDGESVIPASQDPGVLVTPPDVPYHPRSPIATIAISDDLVNTAMHEIWRLGALRQTLDQALLDSLKAPVSLVAGFLGSVSAGVDPESPLAIVLDAPLPPILTATDEPGEMGIVLGDLAMHFKVNGEELVTGYLTLGLAADALIDGDELALDFGPYESAFDLETTDPTQKQSLEAGVEPFVSSLVAELGPLFRSLLGAIPVPQIGPFRPAELELGDDGTNGAYLVIRGGLVRVE